MNFLDDYISHCRDRGYMSGVERDKHRIKQTNEVFTPTYLVKEILNDIEKEDPYIFTDLSKKILDNSCGDGQFLSEIVISRLKKTNCTLEEALINIYGIELMEDNVIECKKRLGGPNPSQEVLSILNHNIICANALSWDCIKWKSKERKKPKALF